MLQVHRDAAFLIGVNAALLWFTGQFSDSELKDYVEYGLLDYPKGWERNQGREEARRGYSETVKRLKASVYSQGGTHYAIMAWDNSLTFFPKECIDQIVNAAWLNRELKKRNR